MGTSRMSRSTWGLAVLACLGSASVSAQTVVERRNFSAERFRLSLDRDGLLSAEWAEVPRHLSWDVSMWLGFADDPLALYRTTAEGRTRAGTLVDSRLGGSLIVALGLFDRVQLGLDLPFVLYQSRPDTLPGVNGQLDGLTRFGVGAPRIAPKIRILTQQDHGLGLALVPTFILPTASQADYTGQDRLLFEPEVLLSRRWGPLRGAFNLGLRLRRPESFADLSVDNEVFARLGAGYDLSPATDVPVELEAVLSNATSLSSPFKDRNQTHLEALFGATYDFEGPFMAFAATGLGLNQGYGTPDWRAMVGLRLSQHGHDEDGDGIDDDLDACPKQAEDLDGFADADGCPEGDNDLDSVPDAEDDSPMGPEDLDGFQDADGIPDPDNDQDGVWDWDDRCPLVAGPVVNQGCPETDRDNDGVLDRLDNCPDDAEDLDRFEDEDGCPDADNDADGVLDGEDRCPLQPGPVAGKGCPDVDTDSDGLVDRLDNCPQEPGLVSEQGCKKRQLVVISGDRLDILEKVYFATGRSTIARRSYKLLDNVAAVLKSHQEISAVQIQGHTDDRGRAQSNLRLSENRAKAVRRYLIKRGIEGRRLSAKGYGEAEPIAPNKTKAGRAENRRVEFKILSSAP